MGNSVVGDNAPSLRIFSENSATFDAGTSIAIQNDGAGLLHITDNVTITSSLMHNSNVFAGVISLKSPYELTGEKIALQVSGNAKIINTRTDEDINPTIYNQSFGKVLLTDSAQVLGNADSVNGVILLMQGERGTISLETASPDVVIKNNNTDIYQVEAIRHAGKGKLVLRGGLIDGNYGRAVSMGSIFAGTTGNIEIHENTVLTAKGKRTVLINNAENVQDMFIMTGGTIISAYEESGTGSENTPPSVQNDVLAIDYGFESKKIPTALLITGDRISGGTSSSGCISGGTITVDRGNAINLLLTSLSGIYDSFTLEIKGDNTIITSDSAYEATIDLDDQATLIVNGGVISSVSDDPQSTGCGINSTRSTCTVTVNDGTIYKKVQNDYSYAIKNVLNADSTQANIIEINGGSVQSLERVCNADKTEYYIKNKDGKNLELYTFTLAHKTAEPSSRESIYPVAETKITKLQFTPEFSYGTNSIFTDLVGKIYTLIPEKSDEFLGLWPDRPKTHK